jgi:hypothetical protein
MRILEKFPPPKDLYKYMLELDQKVENEEQVRAGRRVVEGCYAR